MLNDLLILLVISLEVELASLKARSEVHEHSQQEPHLKVRSNVSQAIIITALYFSLTLTKVNSY